MNLLHKMLVAPAVAILLMLILGGVGYWSMNSQHVALENLFNGRFAHASVATGISAGVLKTHSQVYRVLAWSSNRSEAFTAKETKILFADYDKLAAEFANWASQPDLSDEEKKISTQMVAQIGKYKKSIAAALDMATADLSSGIMAMQTADDDFKKLSGLAESLVTLQNQLGKEDVGLASTVFSRALVIAIIVLVAAISIAGALSFFMARGIMWQLGGEPTYAAEVTRSIAEGDLTVSIQTRPGDHVSLLAAMKQMQEALRQIIGQIHRIAHQVAQNASQMTLAARKVSQGSDQQNDSAAAMAAAVEQMTVSISHVASNAEDARGMAAEAGAQTEEGNKVVKSAIADINKIADSFSHSTQLIQTMGDQSHQISSIANVIKEIADQTNLLALNAAIEAARAGEQGRGFAVVADEVRKLAERTTHSTQEISTMIVAIQSGTQSAMQGMTEGGAQVSNGVHMAAKAGDSMVQIEVSTHKVLNAVAEISAALHEQRATSNLISQNVERIANMAEENGNAVKEVAMDAEQLENLAVTLKASVEKFRV